MGYTGIEPIIHELARRMEEDLPAIIDLKNAEITDGFTIQAPQPANIYKYVPEPGSLNYFPAIGIGDGRSQREDDIGSAETAIFKPMIVVYEQAASQEELAWRLRRLSAAVTEAAMAGRNLGEAAWGVQFDISEPGPTLVDDPTAPKEWVSWTGIRIIAKRDEE
jgi:hypothetical protein